MPSLTAQRTLGVVNRKDAEILEKLSSADRIVRAAYDPAGLAISEGQRAALRSLGQARRNANDAVSIFQVAEGALQEGHNIAGRLRELAMQAANGAIGDPERQVVDIEFQRLKDQMEAIANSTSYNGLNLLNGKSKRLDLQIGIKGVEGVDVIGYLGQKTDVTLKALKMGPVSVSRQGSAQRALSRIDEMINTITAGRTEMGALLGRVKHIVQNIDHFHENTSAAKSRIRDADIAVQTSENVANQIRKKATTELFAQANQRPKTVLKLID